MFYNHPVEVEATWSKAAVARAIELYKVNEDRIVDKTTKKKAVWSEIAATLQSEKLSSVSFLKSKEDNCFTDMQTTNKQ